MIDMDKYNVHSLLTILLYYIFDFRFCWELCSVSHNCSKYSTEGTGAQHICHQYCGRQSSRLYHQHATHSRHHHIRGTLLSMNIAFDLDLKFRAQTNRWTYPLELPAVQLIKFYHQVRSTSCSLLYHLLEFRVKRWGRLTNLQHQILKCSSHRN